MFVYLARKLLHYFPTILNHSFANLQDMTITLGRFTNRKVHSSAVLPDGLSLLNQYLKFNEKENKIKKT